jgi:sugar lactone lactonase YvrE
VSPDGKTLVVNDLWGNQVLSFDVASDGSLSGRRLFADLGDASPDGVCLDAEGAAWIGQPLQGRVRRILDGGEVTHEINYGKKWGIAPVLGGDDRRTLFLCTADIDLETILALLADPRDARQKCRGWIEAVEGIETPGAGTP